MAAVNSTMPDTLDDVERQLDKMRATADNLDARSAMAKTPPAVAKQLSDQAVEWRLAQFQLYRKKDKIVATSNEWKAVVAGVELVNERIEKSISDQKALSDVINTVATVLSVVASLLGVVAIL